MYPGNQNNMIPHKNVVVLVAAFVSIMLLIVARHHPPSRRKIKEIWHGRVFWEGESNTTMLRSAPIQINEKQLDDGASRQENEENEASQIPRTSTNKNAKKNTYLLGSEMKLLKGELPGDDWSCVERGDANTISRMMQWLRNHVNEDRKRILFIGDSVTMQWPRSIVCALQGPLHISVGNIRRFKGMKFDDTLQDVYSRGVAPWYNDKLVPAPPWPKVPFAEDWYIEECNCTIGHLLTYRFLTDSDNNMKSLSYAAFEAVIKEYDVIIFGMGYHFKKTQSNQLKSVYNKISNIMENYIRNNPGRKTMFHETFPQHFKGESGLYENRGNNRCFDIDKDKFYKSGGNWRNSLLRKSTKLPIISTVSSSLNLAYLKKGNGDCTHWNPNPTITMPLWNTETTNIKTPPKIPPEGDTTDTAADTSTKREMQVMVSVLSRRSAFETRQTIRETWASGHNNVFFAVGVCCPIPPNDRKKWTCKRAKSTSVEEQSKWDMECAKQDLKIAEEEAKYKDIIRMPDIDVYRHLPQKVKFSYKWGLEHTTAKWFVKTDDDSVVRIDTLGSYLEKTYKSDEYVVVGRVADGWGVPRSGKWAENNYKPSTYPKFPLGSVGHVVSKGVASYIAENSDKLFNYQGEDISIGIWLNESPLKSKVKWVTSKHMTNHGNCKDTGMWVMGHNIKPAKMRECFAHKDEIITHNKEGNDTTKYDDGKRTESKEPTSDMPPPQVKRVYIDGYMLESPGFAETLFPEFAPAIPYTKTTQSTSNDILIIGMGGSTHGNIKQFKGKILNFNGESIKYKETKPRNYYIGPVQKEDQYNLRVPYVAFAVQYIGIPAKSAIMNRPRNTGERFLIYVSKRCRKMRENVFDELSKIGEVYAASKCHGSNTVYKQDKQNVGKSWTKTYKIMNKYRFALTFENANVPYYHTEKIMSAFTGGAIPIYWGAETIFEMFNRNAFIMYDSKNPLKTIEQIKYLEYNSTAYNEMLSQPMFADGALEKYFSLSDEIGGGWLKKRIRNMLLTRDVNINDTPSFLTPTDNTHGSWKIIPNNDMWQKKLKNMPSYDNAIPYGGVSTFENIRAVVYNKTRKECALRQKLVVSNFQNTKHRYVEKKNGEVLEKIKMLMDSFQMIWWIDMGGLLETIRCDKEFNDDLDISYMPKINSGLPAYQCSENQYACNQADAKQFALAFKNKCQDLFPEFGIRTFSNELHITLYLKNVGKVGEKIIDFAPMVITLDKKEVAFGFGAKCSKEYGKNKGWPCAFYPLSAIFPLQECYAMGVAVPCPGNLPVYTTLLNQREYVKTGISNERCHGCTSCLLWSQKINGKKSYVDKTIEEMEKLRSCHFGSLLSLKETLVLQNDVYTSCNAVNLGLSVKNEPNILPVLERGSGKYKLDFPNGMKAGTSWSQWGQDKYVDSFFKQKREGFFVEIGGYDGEKFSNTLFLEQKRGWDGLLVEANPYTYQILKSRDRKCWFINACVSDTVDSMTFLISGSTTSAEETMTSSFRKRINKDINTYGKNGDKRWAHSGDKVKTKCRTLTSMLLEIGRTHIDYFSLDVEGAEMFILESIPFEKINIDIFSIETDQKSAQIIKFMKSKGYEKHHKIRSDTFFVHN